MSVNLFHVLEFRICDNTAKLIAIINKQCLYKKC